MSLRLVDAVWQSGPESSAHRFVLLSIATFARRDGTARVSARVLMQRTGSDSITMTQVLEELLCERWFSRESTPDGPPVYRLNLDKLRVAPPSPITSAGTPAAALCARCRQSLTGSTKEQ